jgi:molybdenum cofactor cytidylyltransferase
MIAAVVLAAGSSTRLGRPKQLVEFNGELLIHRATATAIAAGLGPVVVVVKDASFIPSLQQRGALAVLNSQHREGISSSIRVGVSAAYRAGASGVVILTCDQPSLTAAHLHKLIVDPESITASGYVGHVGIPAYFPVTKFEALLQLQGDTGARSLLHNAVTVIDEDLRYDIDTEEDLAHARRLFG